MPQNDPRHSCRPGNGRPDSPDISNNILPARRMSSTKLRIIHLVAAHQGAAQDHRAMSAGLCRFPPNLARNPRRNKGSLGDMLCASALVLSSLRPPSPALRPGSGAVFSAKPLQRRPSAYPSPPPPMGSLPRALFRRRSTATRQCPPCEPYDGGQARYGRTVGTVSTFGPAVGRLEGRYAPQPMPATAWLVATPGGHWRASRPT